MPHFKVRVLHAAIDQINEHTDLYDVEYQQYHSGRSIKDPEQISKWKKHLLKHGFKFPQAK